MVDREKVIRALENCTARYKCRDCPWESCEDPQCSHNEYPDGLITAALELLKAQEPRKPYYTKLEYIVDGMPVAINHPECPRCYDNGLVLWDAEIEKGAAYCKRCGQAVKWDAE